MAALSYEVAVEQDVPALVRLMRHAFAAGPDVEQEWIRPTGLHHFRVARAAGDRAPRACLLRIPKGQHFGGKRVGMVGIAGVAVAPEARGGGVARWMMGECVRESAADGFALSCLYASTHALYRQAGYEEAGIRQVTKIPVQRLSVRAREPGVRPLDDADQPAVEACYRAFASRYNGTLDRSDYNWRRVRDWRGQKYEGFGVDDPARPGVLEAYVYFRQERREDGTQAAVISDLAFATARGGRRVLGLIADLGTMVSEATLGGAPWPPVLSLLDAHRFDVAKSEQWMLRVCDVRRALEERGYPRHVSAEIVLNVHDPAVRANAGTWTFTVGHGRARAVKEATVRPAITLSINALASIYSGFYTARQAAGLGWAEGNEAALEAADAVFGGFGAPWMTDFF